MRLRFLALATLLSTPAFAAEPPTGTTCTATGTKGEPIAEVKLVGDFPSCIKQLLVEAKKKCGAELELKVNVTGTERGKQADFRVLRVDCPGDGGHLTRPLPPPEAQKKKK